VVNDKDSTANSGDSGRMMIPWWKVYLRVSWACRTPLVLCLDLKYRPLDVEVVSARAKAFPKWNYAPDVMDCDDAAHAFRAFAGHGVGIALSHKHVWNIALCHDGVWHIEPQNGTMTRKRWALLVVI
jgi:hypothetical protein